MKWWAYRHDNGTIHAKRFLSQASVDDAYESDFVDEVLDPFDAETRKQAEQIACEKLTKKENA